MGVLALIGLIVILLFAYHMLRQTGRAVVGFWERVLDRLSAGGRPPAPSGRSKEIANLTDKIDALKGRKPELPQEIKDEIEKLTA